jgi:hypothetical protein
VPPSGTTNATDSKMPAMDELEQERFLAEYQANVELWKHDDTLRQQRVGNFLSVNAALVAALGIVTSLKPSPQYTGGVGLLFAAFGFLLCIIWQRVQVRNAEYIRFRRFQLRSIESKLPGLSTFQNVYSAFYNYQPIAFESPIGKFTVSTAARKPSTLLEGLLPFLIGGFWFATAIVAVIFLTAVRVPTLTPGGFR